MGTTSRSYPAGDLRVSDADRDAALSELSEHFQVGRLTAAEFDERAGRAISARTGKQLADLMTDLPDPPASPASPASPDAPPGASANSATGANQRHLTRRWDPVTTAVALAAIGAAVAIVAILGQGQGQGHEHGGPAPWGVILVGLFVLRRITRSGRDRSRRGE